MIKTIWMFKEQRSGSSILAENICRLLGLEYVFVEEEYQDLPRPQRIGKIVRRTSVPSDHESLLHTHLFEATTSLPNYTNPIVLRCSRRNKFEQFLSWLTVKKSNWSFFHLSSENQFNQNQIFENMLDQKIVVEKSDFDQFMLLQYSHDKFWKLAEAYPNQVIYYEDMLTGPIDIPVLGLYNVKIESNIILKNPDNYKTEIFVNYEEVKDWFNQIKI